MESLGSRCHSHSVVRCELLLSILPDCVSFHLQGPRIVVLSLSPLTVSDQHLANNRFSCTGVICYFSVPTLLAVCFTRFTVDSLLLIVTVFQVHLVRPPLSIIGVVAQSVFSFTGDVLLWRFHWQTLGQPQLLAHRRDRKVH